MAKRNRKGFTLIELLIVVAIIGILAAIAVPNFLNAQTRDRIAQVESNMRALATAYEMYHVDYSSYPLHDPAHRFNIWGNALTTPVAYIASEPFDYFQQQTTSQTRGMASDSYARLHPEPFYAPAWGHPSMDTIPARGSGGDLTVRFRQDPALYQKAQGMWPNGRYVVSVGPSTQHEYPGVYHPSNGLISRGDIIRVIP